MKVNRNQTNTVGNTPAATTKPAEKPAEAPAQKWNATSAASLPAVATHTFRASTAFADAFGNVS